MLGTRPEIIKLAPVIHEFERRGVEYCLLHTGQHYSEELSEKFFHDMRLKRPDITLDVGSGTHAEQTAKAMVGIEKELIRTRPDVVLVQGDTNTTLSAALAAAKLRIPIGHIEAGLRSYDRRMPEEHNRRLTDHISDYLFAPTERAAETLRREDVWGEIFVTGNTVIDAIEDALRRMTGQSRIVSELGLNDFMLMTLHRAENVDDKDTLAGILEGVLSIGRHIVFPVHPRTRDRLTRFGLMDRIQKTDKMTLIEPPGYLDFLSLLAGCSFVLTDSGGIQEEVTAPSINKRVFVLRTSTERPEAVESGHAVVVGVDPAGIRQGVEEGIRTWDGAPRRCPFGSGDASVRIADILERRIGNL
ncbi:MAG: UDP-N-acetylglucosamine 2-epimerase (non-hydrolyzing) [Candidatus Thorarchaeota archaeon]